MLRSSEELAEPKGQSEMEMHQAQHGVVAVLWLWLLGHLQENTACLLLRLQCQSGEKEPVCHSRGFSSFLPAPLLAPHLPWVQRTV